MIPKVGTAADVYAVDMLVTQIEQAVLQTVTPGPAGFLVVSLDVFRQIAMDDKPHIRFIDAHPKRDRRADDFCFVAQK